MITEKTIYKSTTGKLFLRESEAEAFENDLVDSAKNLLDKRLVKRCKNLLCSRKEQILIIESLFETMEDLDQFVEIINLSYDKTNETQITSYIKGTLK